MQCCLNSFHWCLSFATKLECKNVPLDGATGLRWLSWLAANRAVVQNFFQGGGAGWFRLVQKPKEILYLITVTLKGPEVKLACFLEAPECLSFIASLV